METDTYFGIGWDSEQFDAPWEDVEFLRSVYESDAAPTYEEIADELGCSITTVHRYMPDDARRGGPGLPYEKVAMFSGGYDSLVSTHYTMEKLDGDAVLHIDTLTGIEENKQFVERVCEYFDWPLEIITPNMELEEFAKKYGFPKAPAHSWIYRYLKHNPLSSFTTSLEADRPVYYTGVRKEESDRRMENVSSERTESSKGRWWWDAPIADFTDEDVADYIVTHGLPRNNVVETIGRSGECFCGAYADRFSELTILQENYPEHYEWVMGIEDAVQEEIGTDEGYSYWGVSGLADDEVSNLLDGEYDTDMELCVNCEGGVHRDIGHQQNPTYEQIYLAGPKECGGFREYAKQYDRTTDWVDPFELNEYDSEREARDNAGDVYEKDMNEVIQSDALLLYRIDGYNLSGGSMEAVMAVERAGIPVIVYNDAETAVPTMIEAIASTVTSDKLTAIQETISYARQLIRERDGKQTLVW